MTHSNLTDQILSISENAFLVLVRAETPEAPDLGRRYEIPMDGLSIGNVAGVDISLPLTTELCQVHIVHRFGAWQLEDLQPVSGVLINGILTHKSQVRDGDILQFGRFAFEFCSDQSIKREFFKQNEEARRVDILTLAYNRGTILWYLEKDLQRYNLWESERRKNQPQTVLPPLSLIMLDVDHFGAFNKTYDHLVGDQVLRGLVERVKGRIRATDIVGRYGGEEFLVYLPSTALPQAMVLAEQIRQRIESPTFDIPPHHDLKVTASLGVAEFEMGMTVNDFIRAANVQMKIAKDGGRNRVVG